MIGDNIKKLREVKNMTQQKFADEIGIKQNSVALIESGKRNISPSLLKSISNAFGVRLEWLETGEGEMYKRSSAEMLAKLESIKGITDKAREFLRFYLNLPADAQDLVADAVAAAAKHYPRKPDNELSREEAHAQLDAEYDEVEAARKRGTSTLSASTTSSGSSKKFGRGT